MKFTMKKLAVTLAIPSLLLTSCAPAPHVTTVYQPNDNNLNCRQLVQEIATAKNHKKAARAEDTFQWKYVLIVPAVIGAFQWDKAESAAEKRIAHLQNLHRKNNCFSQMNQSSGQQFYDPTPSFGSSKGYNPASPGQYQPRENTPLWQQDGSQAPSYPTNNNSYGQGRQATGGYAPSPSYPTPPSNPYGQPPQGYSGYNSQTQPNSYYQPSNPRRPSMNGSSDFRLPPGYQQQGR